MARPFGDGGLMLSLGTHPHLPPHLLVFLLTFLHPLLFRRQFGSAVVVLRTHCALSFGTRAPAIDPRLTSSLPTRMSSGLGFPPVDEARGRGLGLLVVRWGLKKGSNHWGPATGRAGPGRAP